MIDVYAFSTPNSVKIPIALEELDLPYALHGVNIRQGEQKAPAFLALNANAKVPVIVDSAAVGGPLTLTESAAILVYLAEKTGKLLPASGAARARVFEQLFFHASGLGPAFGNAGYLTKFAPEPVPFAIERFQSEGRRILGLLDQTLARQAFVAGDALTIADIAHFGWDGGARSRVSTSTQRRASRAGTSNSRHGRPFIAQSPRRTPWRKGEEMGMAHSILVTGASKGIGRATADALADAGWSVIGVARTAPPASPDHSPSSIPRMPPPPRLPAEHWLSAETSSASPRLV